MCAEGVCAKSVASEVDQDDREDEEDDESDPGEQHDEKEARLIGWFLFQVSELLLQVLGKVLQVVREMLGMMILVFHVVLDADPEGGAK